uniref:Uncharacterized protein n=1 Tax=Romanomermis culicivorax TaxID=13658 RepID=A0A915JYC8_ROMCU
MKPVSPIPYPKPCCSTSCSSSSAAAIGVSRFSKFCPQQSPTLLARKALLKKVQKREMQKLRSVLPRSSLSKFRVQSSETRKICRRQRKIDDDLAVVLGAVHYIGQLQTAILVRIQAGTLPPDALTNIQPVRTLQKSSIIKSLSSVDSGRR